MFTSDRASSATPIFRNAPFTPWSWLAMATLTLAAAVVRFYALGRQSLWFDELATWHTGSWPTWFEVVFADRSWNLYPPAYGILTRIVLLTLGDSEWALRFPSALAGTLAVPLLYLLVARAANQLAAALASASMALLLFPIYYSQEARPYALLLCGILLCVWSWSYFIDPWRERRRAPRWSWLVYGIAATFCSYLHYFGLLFVFLHGLATFALLLRRPSGLLRAFTLYSATALAFVPWLPSMYFHFANQNNGPQMPPVEPNVFTAFYHFVESAFGHGQAGLATTTATTWLALALMGSALMNLTWTLTRKNAGRSERSRTALLAALIAFWLLAPFLLAYGKSAVSASIFTHRNLIISLPAIYIVCALGLTSLPITRYGRAAASMLIISLLTVRLATAGFYDTPHKSQYREATAYVLTNNARTPNAELVVYSHANFTFDYYLRKLRAGLKPALMAGNAATIPAMRAFVSQNQPQYVWYMCAAPFPDRAFVDYMNAEFDILRQEKFLRVFVFLLHPKNLRAEPTANEQQTQ